MGERRKATRYPCDVNFEIDLPDGGIKGQSQNISARGISCVVDHYVPLYARMTVEMNLPGEDGNHYRFECEGVVVRIDPEEEQPDASSYTVSIYFPDISSEKSLELDLYLMASQQINS